MHPHYISQNGGAHEFPRATEPTVAPLHIIFIFLIVFYSFVYYTKEITPDH